MATIRIYKIAEVLGTTSQEVISRLKRDHGIEVKSASSTVEEVVARQFVERVARERGLTPPRGAAMFAEAPPAAKGKGGKAMARPAEPPRPVTAPLPPPRLVKTVKPAPVAAEVPAPHAPVAGAEPVASVDAAEAAERTPVPALPSPQVPPPSGRVVPPTLRLRVEEPPAAVASAFVPPAASAAPTPAASSAEVPAAPRPVATPAAAAASTAAVPVTTRTMPVAPAAAKPAPPAPVARPRVPPPAARPLVPSARPPIGGPRPLPTPPIRPPTQPRPGMAPQPAARPPSTYRPPWRPAPTGPRPARPHPRPTPALVPTVPPPITRTVTLAEGMTVKDLADRLEVKAKDILKKLLDKRLMFTINSTLDADTAQTIARDFGAEVQIRSFEEEILDVEAEEAQTEDLAPRAPVVTVMGHVDHGKTTLLDAIRETRVAEQEAGGITQHIGAYAVDVGDRKVVFLDTPGHEAFTLMRARGARITDVVVVVVAADDGVMPQTREAIDHARAAGVPMIVAINKIDKPEANPDHVKKQLAELGLVPEEWGGQTVMVEVSAKKRQRLDLLLEMILLVTEMSELKANPKRSASGTVLEAKLDRGRGPVATVLVQDGLLHVGDHVLAGTVVGKVRALIDHRGRHAKSAGPATPVEMLGLSDLPQPGDLFRVLADAAKARQIAMFRQTQAKERAVGVKTPRLSLETLRQQITEGGVKELPIIIKADVQGSAEVLAETLTKLGDERVKVRIIHSGVGAISESDVLLASASNAIIVGFDVRPDRNAADVAERERVDVRLHSVIYNVTDEIKLAMAGLLEPTLKEVRMGLADVRQIFRVPKVGTVAGCMVTEGRVTRAGDAQARLLRDHVVIHEGRIASLRRFKDDVGEVKAGFECGIALERYQDVKPGDVIEVFTVERVAATV